MKTKVRAFDSKDLPLARALVSAMLLLAINAVASPPAWVARFPNDPDHYIGIGRAEKRIHPADYRERAQAEALAQISREISVLVKTDNVMTKNENAAGWEEEFGQKTETSSQNSLYGYQLEDTYETGTEFWSLYTMDKKLYGESLEERTRGFVACMDREATAIQADLSARRIQAAVQRYNNLKAGFIDFKAANPGPVRGWMEAEIRFTELTGRIQTSLGSAQLVSLPKHWSFAVDEEGSQATSSRVKAFLVNASSGERWQGPISFTLKARRDSQTATCQLVTDGENELDLAQAFIHCGLEPGAWRLEWTGVGLTLYCDVEAQWRPVDYALDFRSEAQGVSATVAARIGKRLESLHGQRFHFVSKRPGIPIVSIRLQELVENSLDGIFFAELRAEVVFPHQSGSVIVKGKSGHSLQEQAFLRAITDLVKNLERLPASGFDKGR